MAHEPRDASETLREFRYELAGTRNSWRVSLRKASKGVEWRQKTSKDVSADDRLEAYPTLGAWAQYAYSTGYNA